MGDPNCDLCGAEYSVLHHITKDVPSNHELEPVMRHEYLCDSCLNTEAKKAQTHLNAAQLASKGFIDQLN